MTKRPFALALALATALLALPTAPRASAPAEDPILADLLAGNAAWASWPEMAPVREELVLHGQHPKTIVLGCSDSRVPPEAVFQKGLGELFVARVAGNVPMSGLLASVEYAVEHLHAERILVLGHTRCGAVTAAAEQLRSPSPLTPDLAALVKEITPAVKRVARQHPEYSTEELAEAAVHVNARLAAERLVERSAVVREALELGHVKVFYGVYDLLSGDVAIEGEVE